MGNLVIDLTAVNDTLVEGAETYTVALATPTSTTGSVDRPGRQQFGHHHHHRQRHGDLVAHG